MRNVFHINNIHEIPSFCPPLHTKTADRKFIDEEMGAQQLAIWHGEMEPGGVAEEHVHEVMEQAFYILEGQALFRLGEDEHKLEKGHLAFVPINQPHVLASVGDTTLKYLVIMAPPPSLIGAWQKKKNRQRQSD